MRLLPWPSRIRRDPASDRSREVISVQQETVKITEQIRDALENLAESIGDEALVEEDKRHE